MQHEVDLKENLTGKIDENMTLSATQLKISPKRNNI